MSAVETKEGRQGRGGSLQKRKKRNMIVEEEIYQKEDADFEFDSESFTRIEQACVSVEL